MCLFVLIAVVDWRLLFALFVVSLVNSVVTFFDYFAAVLVEVCFMLCVYGVCFDFCEFDDCVAMLGDIRWVLWR